MGFQTVEGRAADMKFRLSVPPHPPDKWSFLGLGFRGLGPKTLGA